MTTEHQIVPRVEVAQTHLKRLYEPLDTSPPPFKDMTGQRFDRLIVVGLLGRSNNTTFWACQCDCGQTAEVGRHDLTSRKTKSCGCFRREATGLRKMTHSLSNSTTYKSWASARQRCSNPNDASYPDYGGRGIQMCERWASFENFVADMGIRPSGMSLDRIDNDLGYQPNNCRWAPDKVQARNKRTTRMIEFQGKRLTLTEWARHYSIPVSTLYCRLAKGKSFTEAVCL